MNRHPTTGNDINSQSHHELLEEIGQLRESERVLIDENDDLRRQLVEMKEEVKKKYDALLVEHQQLKANANRSQRAENGCSLVPIAPNNIHIKQEHLNEQSDNGHQMDNEDNPNTNAHNVTVNIKTEPMDCDFVVVKLEEVIKEEDEDDCGGCDRCLVKKEELSDDDEQLDHNISAVNDKVQGPIEGTTVEAHLINVNQIMMTPSSSACNITYAPHNVQSTNDIFIKHEYVPAYIKTESNDFEEIGEFKQEIKEEDEDCNGCERCLVKKELMSDDDEQEDNEGGGRGQRFEEMDDEGGDHKEVIGANGDQLAQSSHVLQSSDEQANIDGVMDQENGLVDEDENKSDLGGDDKMPNTTKDNHDRPMVVSNEASTSARPRSNRVTSKQSTGSTVHNATKRKQTQTNRTVKRSKKAVEDDDGEVEFANEDRVDKKIKVINLNCTDENCEVKLNSLDQLHSHLLTIHGLLPLRCFAQNCNSRFDNSRQMAVHIKQHHSNATHFVCHICGKEFTSQNATYRHWSLNHPTGQFECNLNKCAQVWDTRQKVHDHQRRKHCPDSKRFACHQPGCSSSFVKKTDLERHELSHLNTRPFHCTCPLCSFSANVRANLIKHIQTHHFGLPITVKEQMEKNIEDHLDPNEYVRVVQEDAQ